MKIRNFANKLLLDLAWRTAFASRSRPRPARAPSRHEPATTTGWDPGQRIGLVEEADVDGVIVVYCFLKLAAAGVELPFVVVVEEEKILHLTLNLVIDLCSGCFRYRPRPSMLSEVPSSSPPLTSGRLNRRSKSKKMSHFLQSLTSCPDLDHTAGLVVNHRDSTCALLASHFIGYPRKV